MQCGFVCGPLFGKFNQRAILRDDVGRQLGGSCQFEPQRFERLKQRLVFAGDLVRRLWRRAWSSSMARRAITRIRNLSSPRNSGRARSVSTSVPWPSSSPLR